MTNKVCVKLYKNHWVGDTLACNDVNVVCFFAFFWVIPQRLNFICRRSETSAYKIQTPANYPEESMQHSEHGESLKSRMSKLFTKV